MNYSHPLQKRIVHCLSCKLMSVRDLADALNHEENVIRTSLEILRDKGIVKQNGMSTGRYPKQLFELVECPAINAQAREVRS